MLKQFWIFLILIFLVENIYSQILKYSNDYLTIGISARNIAIGGSVVATDNNLSASYYNSAGLSNLPTKYDASFMHSAYFAGIANYDYAGFAYKLNDSMGLAVSIIRLGVDNIQNTLFLIDDNGNVDYSKIKLFSVADYALLTSFGRKTKIEGLSIGANVVLIYRHQGEFANGYGLRIDIGAQYKLKNWQFGADLTNATTSFTAWFVNISNQMRQVYAETGNDLPHNSLEITMPQLNTGSGRYFKLSNKTGLRGEIDLDFTFDGKRNAMLSLGAVSIYPQAGIEFNVSKILYLRAGVNNFQFVPDFRNNDTTANYFKPKNIDFVPNIGIGIVYKGFYLDYALTDVANQSIALYSHVFSVGVRF